jgi:hypothetical protein
MGGAGNSHRPGVNRNNKGEKEVMDIHPSHLMVSVPVNNAQECANCWACTCHDSSNLGALCPDA